MRRLLLTVAALLVVTPGSGMCRGDTIAAWNTSSLGNTLAPFTEVELEVVYSSPAIRFTGMRLWFQAGLSGPVTTRFHDGDGHDTGPLTGSFYGTAAGYDIYEFDFGSQFLGNQSQYYASYDFKNNGIDIGIGATTNATISYDAALTTVSYSSLQPAVDDPVSPTYGLAPRFEILAVPEPASLSLASTAAIRGYAAWWWGRRRSSCSSTAVRRWR